MFRAAQNQKEAPPKRNKGKAEKQQVGKNSKPFIPLAFATMLCTIAGGIPMIISFNTIPEKSGNNNWLFLIVIAVIALVTLTKAARNFGRELSFYREHSLDDDSGVQTQMKSFSRLSGRNRMFLYYPFVFFAASFAISFVVLILRSN